MRELVWYWLGCGVLGGVPFALLLGFCLGVDIRRVGSGNVGATNLGRVAGKFWGTIAFILDAAKGLAPLLWARESFEAVRAVESSWPLVIGGACAILGHCYSPFLKFRGGKGVATAAGVLLVLAPLASSILFGIWLMSLIITRIIGVASSCAAAASVIIGVDQLLGFVVARPDAPLGWFLIALGVLVLQRHRKNIAAYFRARQATRTPSRKLV
ncbi:MAG: glycerol-3-phosphate acyltransferase [Planctomycetota bacterium]